MRTSCTYAIGVMSGTSLDGVDLCYVKFNDDDKRPFDIIAATTISYPTEWKDRLVAAFRKAPHELQELHKEYGTYLGELIQQFMRDHTIEEVDFIASHGHTIFHKPEEKYTLQIGDGSMIARITGIKVVSDFRSQDVQLGGQGAPLVPIGDRLLFSEFDYCLNLGGFANISFEQQGKRLAFDISPINIVFNHYTQQQGIAFDDGGKLAAQGEIDTALFTALNDLDFYAKPPPKSLGFEWVNTSVLPMIDRFKLPLNDVLATFSHHVAFQIAKVVEPSKTVLATGGGAYNTFFMNQLTILAEAEFVIPSKEIVEYKEALIFALLGRLRIQGKVNVLKEVTGASKDHCSGRISVP